MFQLAANFQATVRVGSETEAHFTAMEKMLQYMKVRMQGLFWAALEGSISKPGAQLLWLLQALEA